MEERGVSVKYSEENSVFGRFSYYFLLEFVWGSRVEVGANSRLAVYSNKYGIKLQRKKGGGIRVFELHSLCSSNSFLLFHLPCFAHALLPLW